MLKGIYFDLEDILTWRVSRPEDNLNLTLYGTGDNLTLGLFETGDNLTLGLSKTSGNLAPELIWILHRLLGELIWNRHRLLSKLIGHWIFLKFFFLVWFFLKEMKQANTPKKKKIILLFLCKQYDSCYKNAAKLPSNCPSNQKNLIKWAFSWEKNVFSIKKSTNSLATTLATKYFTQKSFPLGQKALFSWIF